MSLNQSNQDTYDVVICGGGLAGMTLARQLKLKMPDISIVVIDRFSRPLPVAAFKVGESTVESSAHYLANTLQLTNYFEKHHFHKLGFRFFLGNAQGSFQERSEVGLSEFHSPYSYQIDRGMFENDLREFNAELGVELLENCSVQDIVLSENEDFHQIVYKQLDTKETQTIKARWVVDAMSRRRFLQKKLGLAKPNNEKFSAVWFRIDGRVDVSDFVPITEEQWHNRVPKKIRYYSTNHLVGEGYWVWLIPLSSGYTSIGIVASKDVHSFEDYHTYEKAYEWLKKHEPVLASHLKARQPTDFMKMPKYSYSSTQVFSINRWTCVGEAGTFVDPLYSPGTDMIGIANSLTTELIRLDLDGKLTKEMVEYANLFFLKYSEQITSKVQSIYQLFGKNSLMNGLRLIWDFMMGWGVTSPVSVNSIYLAPEKLSKIQNILEKIFTLMEHVNQLLSDWSTKSLHRISFEFIDYLALPFVQELRSRNLTLDKTDYELIFDSVANLEIFEELAQVIFLLAIEDTMPEKLAMFPSPVWLNAWAISLDPNRWECDGLFEPESKPRDLNRIMEPLRKNIRFNSLAALSTVHRKKGTEIMQQ
jgi:flavin-dependent dehydrogenase